MSASLQVAYEAAENILLVAMRTIDQSWVINPNAKWNRQDGFCDIYLSLEHADGASPVVQFNIYGDRLEYGRGQAVEVAVTQHDSGFVYEWRIDLEEVFGANNDIGLGSVLGPECL